MAYIDLNMVRAGIVGHPAEWPDCGFHEIRNHPQPYTIIDRQKLAELASIGDLNSLKDSHMGWLYEMQPLLGIKREEKWSTSIAVGGEKFVTKIKQLLGVRATGRRLVNMNGSSELREPLSSYSGNFGPENDRLNAKNMHYWDINHDNTAI